MTVYQLHTGAWMHHGNMTDNMVNVGMYGPNVQRQHGRITIQLDKFFNGGCSECRWILVHQAKSREDYLKLVDMLLAHSNHTASPEPAHGPFLSPSA